MNTFIDLSHTIEDGLVTYKGLPAPIVCDFLSREESKKHYGEGTSFHIGKIEMEMCANTGIYIDSPFHRYEDGKDISQLDLESVASIDGVKIEVDRGATAIDADAFSDFDVFGKAVLVQTNWSENWNTEKYYEGHPYLTESAARYLQENGAWCE